MKNEYEKLKHKSMNYSACELADILGFDQALITACKMLNNIKWDESLQKYATTILESLRTKFPEKWNSSWRFDALLGFAYDIILKYDERYDAFKRASDKISPIPPQLLIALARCCIAPGKPPVTENEAISLVKQAIQKIPYVEGVELLRGLYKSTGNIREQIYWEKILDKLKEDGCHLPPLDYIPKEIMNAE